MVNRKFRWIPPVFWGLLITVLSIIPGGPGNLNFLGIPYFDKVGHFGMYAVWAFLIFNACAGNPGWSLRKAFWWTLMLGACVGVGLEFLQNMMALGRQFEIWDMVANACGVIVGGFLGRGFFKVRSRRN